MCLVDLGLKTTRTAVEQTADHAVGISKSRRSALGDAVADRLRGRRSEVAQAKILALKIHPDHVPLVFSAPPTIAPSLALQWFKGLSAHGLFAEFPHRRRRVRQGHLWAPSFSVRTAGHVSAPLMQCSIERAELVRTRR